MNKLTAKRCREQFEEWLSGITGSSQQFIRQWRSESGYADDFEHLSLWWAWQASRTAIELDIDWPEANDDYWKEDEEGAYARGHEDGKDKTALAVRQALKSAGIKVNP